MSKIRIKNFGPIKEGFDSEDGFMDVKKVTVFIGDQGSGKSTVAKLISTFTWMEKALTRGDRGYRYFETRNTFKNQYLTYHRIENYFRQDKSNLPPGLSSISEIDYEGDSCDFQFNNGRFYVQREDKKGNYDLPQIMYVPAERNFIASIKEGQEFNLELNSLIEFINDYRNTLKSINGPIHLPIGEVDVEYNKFSRTVYLKGRGYRIKLLEASSGYHSIVPLFLVARFLSKGVKTDSERASRMTSAQRERFGLEMQSINETPGLTEEQKRIARSEIGKKFNKTAFINIVEEPEQNLYPSSQKAILNSLVEFNNDSPGNMLIMTTHSPYMTNYITMAVKAFKVRARLAEQGKNFDDDINAIVPIKSLIDPEELVIYELDDCGKINKLPTYKGLPEDNNYLNDALMNINDDFDQLRQIEKR